MEGGTWWLQSTGSQSQTRLSDERTHTDKKACHVQGELTMCGMLTVFRQSSLGAF